ARTWQDHDRSDDMLWTGTAFREFRLWRERYPGGLTETEQAFGDAMTALAGRRRRRRRLGVTAAFAILLAGLVIVGSFWQRSVRETRRAEAQKLFALAQIELATDRTASLAYATSSLELADDPEVRKLAIKALWQGPQKFVVAEEPSWEMIFTPDGRRLVKTVDANDGAHIEIFTSDGTGLDLEDIHHSTRVTIDICPDSDLLASWNWLNLPGPRTVALRSMSQPQLLGTHRYEGEVEITAAWEGRRLLLQISENGFVSIDALDEDGSHRRLGNLAGEYTSPAMDSQTGQWLGAIRGDEVVVFRIGNSTLGQPRYLGRHPGALQALFHPRGDFLVTMSPDGEIRFWDPSGSTEPRVFKAPTGISRLSLIADASILAARTKSEVGAGATLWSLAGETPQLLRRFSGDVPQLAYPTDPAGRAIITNNRSLLLLAAPPGAEPIPIGGQWTLFFHPDGDWLSSTGNPALLWHLSRPLSIVIARMPRVRVVDLEFERLGNFLAVAGGRNHWVRLWPLEEPDTIHLWDAATGQQLEPVAMDSQPLLDLHFLSEDQFLVATQTGFMKISLDGGAREMLLKGSFRHFTVSRDGRRALLLEGEIMDFCSPEPAVVFDLETGVATPLVSHGSDICSIAMDEAGLIVVTGNADGEIRVGPITGEEPHLLVADSNIVFNVELDPRGRWIASSGLVSKTGGMNGEGVVRSHSVSEHHDLLSSQNIIHL
ncbi:MAG: hypothetical protein DRJ61_17920, partial [Acidobacteria bacterium]